MERYSAHPRHRRLIDARRTYIYPHPRPLSLPPFLLPPLPLCRKAPRHSRELCASITLLPLLLSNTSREHSKPKSRPPPPSSPAPLSVQTCQKLPDIPGSFVRLSRLCAAPIEHSKSVKSSQTFPGALRAYLPRHPSLRSSQCLSSPPACLRLVAIAR